jgi:hypothetical protein
MKKPTKLLPSFVSLDLEKNSHFFILLNWDWLGKKILFNFYAFQVSSAPPHLVKTGPRFSLINLISFQWKFYWIHMTEENSTNPIKSALNFLGWNVESNEG